MARLDSSSPIPASQQFGAVARLRWNLFRNGFRRKGGAGELVARIIVFPIAALFVIGPSAGAFATSYFAARDGNFGYLIPIFTVILFLQILVSINISQPGLSFDPESLIRFPVSFPRFLIIRIFLGLLAVSTIVGTCALLSSATAISLAAPRLAPAAFAAAISLALANMLFIRMIFAWVDRWLSTRRAREIFTVLIFVFSIGIQYANVTFNNVGHHANRAQQAAKVAAAIRFYHYAQPLFMALPPGLAGSAIVNAGRGAPTLAFADILGVLVAAAIFLAVFASRMSREYRGENLSEASAQSPTRPAALLTKRVPHLRDGLIVAKVGIGQAESSTAEIRNESLQASTKPSLPSSLFLSPSTLSPILLAALQKEWIYVRRNPTQFYGLIAPLAMVFILAARLGSLSRTGLIFPIAAAYSILGVAAMAYNVLGLDAAGVQFYFLAPVSFRSLFLAKNLFGFGVNIVQIVLLYIILTFTAGMPGFWITLSTLSWLVFAVLINATIGNMRSITAPKKVDPSKLSRKQASQLSALLSLGIMLVIGAFGAGLIFLARNLALPWLPVPILLALALGAFALYITGLSRLDALALTHRETLIEELSKVSI